MVSPTYIGKVPSMGEVVVLNTASLMVYILMMSKALTFLVALFERVCALQDNLRKAAMMEPQRAPTSLEKGRRVKSNCLSDICSIRTNFTTSTTPLVSVGSPISSHEMMKTMTYRNKSRLIISHKDKLCKSNPSSAPDSIRSNIFVFTITLCKSCFARLQDPSVCACLSIFRRF